MSQPNELGRLLRERDARALLESSFDGIWAIDSELKTTFANARMAEMLGYSPEEMLGRLLTEFLFPEDQQSELEAIGRRRSGVREEMELRYRHKNGSEIWARVATAPVLGDGGAFNGAVAIHSDISDRRRSEHLLQQREAELKEIERVAAIGYWRWDLATDSVQWSEGVYRIMGRDASLPAVPLREQPCLYTPESWVRLESAIQQAVESGSSYELDLELVREDRKETLWVVVRGEAERETRGAVCALHGTMQDITERKKMESELRDSEEHVRFTLEAANIGTWEWDIDTGSVKWSENMVKIHGECTESFEGNLQSFLARVEGGDRQAVVEALKSALEGDGKYHVEYREVRKDVRDKWIEAIGRVQYDTSDRPVRMIGVSADITNRKLAEIDRFQLASIVESSEDAIISKALDGRITSWNAGATRIFGYLPEEIIGKPIFVLIPPELHDEEREILKRLQAGERIEHYEAERLRKDGEGLTMSLAISPIRDSKGRVVGASKIGRDITQRKRTEEALRTSEKLASVGRLAATVAHEINNPLESVVNLVYLARMEAEKPDLVRQHLSMAEEELQRVAQLTHQTLGFYRQQNGSVRTRIGELLQQLLTVFRTKASSKGIKIDLSLKDDPELMVRTGEIRQLFANLLNNSIDACRNGGRIRVRVSACSRGPAGSKGARITVADNGSGIPADARAHVMEPFFTTKSDVGTGLGLWVCKEIVEKHGGSIRMRSATIPGRSGTAVSVFLPESAEEVRSKSSGAFKEVA